MAVWKHVNTVWLPLFPVTTSSGCQKQNVAQCRFVYWGISVSATNCQKANLHFQSSQCVHFNRLMDSDNKVSGIIHSFVFVPFIFFLCSFFFFFRHWWDMFSLRDSPTNASNLSPTSPAEDSLIWTMTSHCRKQDCVRRRLCLCRREISPSPCR